MRYVHVTAIALALAVWFPVLILTGGCAGSTAAEPGPPRAQAHEPGPAQPTESIRADMVLTLPADAAAPTVDGYISDDEWSDAMMFVGLTDTADGQLVDLPLTGYLKSDGQHLYLAVRREVFSSEHLVQNASERDDHVYADDSYELYFYPELVGDDFYQIVVNPLGTVFDRHGDDVSWNADVRTAHNFGKREQGGMTRWDVEMSIRLEDVGITGDPMGRSFRLGLFINQMSPRVRSYSLTEQQGLYLQPDRAALVRFVPTDQAISLASLGRPLLGQVRPELRIGAYAGRVRATLTPDGGRPVELIHDHGSGTLRLPPVLRGSGAATLVLAAPADDQDEEPDYLLRRRFTYDITPLSLEAVNFPSLEQVRIETDYEAFARRDQVRRYTVTVGDRTTTLSRGADTATEPLVVSTVGLEPGAHDITVTLFNEHGDALLDKTIAYTKEGGQAWLDNTIGIDPGYVPPPYTPMQIDGPTVRVIGRALTLADTGLPERITSLDRDLLAEPIRITGTIDGEPAELTATRPFDYSTVAADDSIGEAVVSLGPLRGTVRQTVSFDGLCWYDVTLDAGDGVEARDVRLEIVMPAEVAVSHQFAGIDFQKAGIDWDQTYEVLSRDWDLPFAPQVWLGNTRVGLAWIAEDHRDWQVADDSRTMQILRDGDRVILRANLVDAPIALKGKLTWSFGLQASPIKPIPSRMGRVMTYNFTNGTIHPYLSQIPGTETFCMYQGHRSIRDVFTRYVGLPEPHWPDRAAAAVARQKALGVYAVPYSTITTLSMGVEDFHIYRGDWDGGSVWTGTANAHADPAPFTECNTQSKTYRDFMVWRFMQSSQAFGGDATYYDLFCPPTVLSGSGTVYSFSEEQKYSTRNGDTALPTLIRSTRDIARRLYIAYKKENPDRVIYANGGGGFYLPMIAFIDAAIAQHNIHVHRYPDMLTYDRFRSGFYGHPLGVKMFFMPHHADNLWALKPMGRYLNGLTLNHNNPMFLSFVDYNLVLPYWRVYYEGDWGTQTFLPYWDHPNLTDLDPEQFKVSGWYNPKTGGGLLCIASQSDQPLSAPIATGDDWTFNRGATLTDATLDTIGENRHLYPGRYGDIDFEGDYRDLLERGHIGATFADGVGHFEPYGVLLLHVTD